MPTRTARTAWNGTLQEGSGQVELSSSKVGTYDVSFPKRAADEAGGTTSPEELIAAAHSSCFAMQLSAVIAEAGGTPESLEVTADVSLGPDAERGGFMLTGIPITVRGEVSGGKGPPVRQARASRTSSAGCQAVRCVPWKICCRQETPVAAMTASAGAERTAGNSRSSPTCIETS